MKKAILTLTLSLMALSAFGSGDPAKKAAKQAEKADDTNKIVAACSAEITAKNCTGKTVGTGLKDCLGDKNTATNKKELSAGCKEVLQSVNAEAKPEQMNK
jgi:hypothetical protein